MLLKTWIPAFLLTVLIVAVSCKKKHNETQPDNQQEESLAFELPEIQLQKYNVAQDSTYALKVNVTSKMPAKGVKVTLNVATETGVIPLPQDDIPDITANPFTVTLKHLKPLKTYEVTINLVSLSNSANIATPQVFYLTNKSDQ
ncbi:hypothetical protein SAMN05660909_00502 [Chitinophaga terrae (ex Kim and Jung 2007)]|jgi:hypothetical protein|uniref:DUF4625 domain-containing protein n=1 Tax=Chitinophaga terrae (ex Kim and Jung 2007) TaxID=408074 RepID=A0A1H3XUS0_9BACT|nr:hypothetical protein [Chitinophaga terrae (ex Kim and Jung 2007)]GEP89400.1 hypothetical protein CTE07_10450 [Chitinophaga terrae (ex Kim and Jung 2007)]SEA03073.1 hypothetical protein SAMN05660909_00502 [Chitinophaga terrae (ex Kim and Jung 2007)]